MREGWIYKKLGEVCEFKAGFTPKQGDLLAHGAYPYFKVAEMNLEGNELFLINTKQYLDSSKKIFPKGAVVFPKNGGAIFTNKKRILAQDSIIDMNTQAVIASESIEHSYLYYLIKNIDFSNYVNGSALPTLALDRIKDILVPVFEKITQQQIVSELDLLSHILDQKRQQLKEYDALAESIFYDMFGDPVENPKGWEVKKLGDICNISSSKRIFANEYVDEGIPFYRGKEVTEKSKGLDPTLELFISRDRYAQIKESFGVPKVGDILITAVGTIGNIWVVDNDDPFYFKDGNIIWLSQISNIDPIYFRKVLEILISAFKLEMSNGCAYSALTIVNLKKMGANFPPLTLQRSFAAKIESIEHQKQLLRASIKETEMLFQSRMDYWFNS